jgi:D-beta-D-heptose 7-phosphate kinase / D-beta-D-heptose 1-phosphate adenosyltransferase
MNRKLNSKILVLGDALLDRYWFGDFIKISSEAPVPVLSINSIDDRAGGAANVAMNIKSLGGNADLMSLVGNDEAFKSLNYILHNNKIQFFPLIENKYVTPLKVRVISKNQQITRADFENKNFIKKNLNLLKLLKSKLKKYQMLVLPDYAKGTLNNVKKIINIANQFNIPILIDPKGNDFSKYSNSFLITPNYDEFINIVGDINSEHDFFEKGFNLINAYNINNLLVTRGKKGMTLISKNQKPYNVISTAKDVFDVTGAGDTVLATIAFLLSKKITLKKSIKLANYSAAISITKFGTSTVNYNELMKKI